MANKNKPTIVNTIPRMKLLCLVALAVFAIAQGAKVPAEISPPGISVTQNLEKTQYDLKLVSPNIEESKELTESDLQQLQERNIITGPIQNIISQIREIVINGNEDVPVLDPLSVPVVGPIDFNSGSINGQLTLRGLQMSGLRWFVADRIDVNPLRLSFGITFLVPSLSFTGRYNANTRIAFVNHEAAGDFNVFTHRIEVGFDLRMGTTLIGGNLFLRELDIHVDIMDTRISVTGMTGSSIINSFINNTIQNVTQEFIQTQLQFLNSVLGDFFFEVINEVLKDYTVSDIFG